MKFWVRVAVGVATARVRGQLLPCHPAGAAYALLLYTELSYKRQQLHHMPHIAYVRHMVLLLLTAGIAM